MPRRRFIVPVVAVICFFAAPATCWPIIIETNTKQRIRGFLVDEDDQTLSIKVIAADGKAVVRKYPRTIVTIVHQVDRSKLAALRPDNPSAYCEYADQLAAQKEDPEAGGVARRLYLFAAFLSSGKKQRECLLSMCSVARNPKEAMRIRALVFLLDPKRDAGVLKQPPQNQDLSWDDFGKSLRYLRTGKVAAALAESQKPAVAACFAAIPDFMDAKRFQQLCEEMKCDCNGLGAARCKTCNGNGRLAGARICGDCSGRGKVICPDCDGRGVAKELTEPQLRTILSTEFLLDKQQLNPQTKKGKSSWSVTLMNRNAAAVQGLTLENLTEIDPRKCIFVNGEWQAP